MTLEIKNLKKNYGEVEALKGVNIFVKPGQIVGLLGPNGSGKTTIIKTITGLLSSYEGEVSINGNSPGVLANSDISYLPDKSHVPTWMKVSQSVDFFSDFYTDFDKPKALEMLTNMEIPLNRKIKSLSRGQQEKVGLSLVMARNAKLYILDEPIGAVDPASRDFIMETILKNQSDGGSILISSHIIADIENNLDYAIFLKQGEVFLEGEANKLREEKGKNLDELFREVFKNVV
ncbi:MAG: ABC transporter ATP-binding protein [Defluviitaleaceae bacterium]|nr:ABC transporter ATP-binding protein [Defluviitaleaceae bacterium]